jgi:CRP-like cAMP-binding protein
MTIVDVNRLREISLFSLMDDTELEALATQLDEVRLLAGQVLFKMGDQGGKMYIVQSGQIELFVQDNANERVTLGVVKADELFGELSLLDNQPRSATAKALVNTSVLAVDRNDLEFLVQSHPAAALDMMSALGQRIRESNALIRERVLGRTYRRRADADEWQYPVHCVYGAVVHQLDCVEQRRAAVCQRVRPVPVWLLDDDRIARGDLFIAVCVD